MSALPTARRAAGITGEADPGTLDEAVSAGAGWRPLLTLAAAGGAVLSQGVVLLLAPDIARSLGTSTARVGGCLGLWSIGILLGLPFGLRAGLRGARTPWAATGGALVASALVVIAFADRLAALVVAAVLAGVGSAIAGGTHRALLADHYPPLALTQVTAACRAGSLAVGALAVGAAFPLVTATGLSWRGGLLVVAGLAVAAAVATALLPEPERGHFESTYVRRLVPDGAEHDALPARRIAFGEALRRLYAVRSVRPALAAVAVLAAAGYGTVVFGSYALSQRGGLSTDDVAWTLIPGAALAAAAALATAGRATSLLRTAPVLLSRAVGTCFLLTAAGIAAAGVLPWTVGAVVGVLLALAALGAAAPALDRLLGVVIPTELRGAGGVLAAAYAGVLGVGAGGSILAGVEGAVGLPLALAGLAIVTAAGALLVRAVGRTIDGDLAHALDGLVEREEMARDRARGVRQPLLTCNRINFSYGPLQILFDVDFSVDEGEMVALLGTNGAGKSTLLRVISGLGTPSSGSVRIRGEDVTYAEPAARVRLGVSQIPGGKAVFGPLSVAENLRLYGYALGRDRKAVERGIEESFATFPRLAERRNEPASTMSGGEQQMLALSKALILRPQLLLIDELSLGLAPVVVGELLALVRKINDAGTAVVLVEQSVNVALSLAHHAYFMEKGQVRFDGPTKDLLDRPDILRSVFLSGVAAATTS